MPPMKIQPIDCHTYREPIRNESTVKPPVLKSRLKRLFDRQFPSVLRISLAAEKSTAGEGVKDGEFEPSSVCLAKMVQNFIEENNHEKQSAKCGRNRCNCFNGNVDDSSDDEFELYNGFFSDSVHGDSSDTLKSLTPCASVTERNLLADTSKIVENHKICKRKDELRKFVADELHFIGYDASICKSRWEKSSSYPAGEYEYVDVIVEGERLLIDVDFRSEFEIARPTGNYKAVLQSLPYIFVGKADRLQQILSVVSEAAKQSLKKKGMHVPPWRKVEYMKSKWLSPHTRTPNEGVKEREIGLLPAEEQSSVSLESDACGDFELIFGENATSTSSETNGGVETVSSTLSPVISTGDDEKSQLRTAVWQPPAIKPKSVERGTKVVTGLASLFKEKA